MCDVMMSCVMMSQDGDVMCDDVTGWSIGGGIGQLHNKENCIFVSGIS